MHRVRPYHEAPCPWVATRTMHRDASAAVAPCWQATQLGRRSHSPYSLHIVLVDVALEYKVSRTSTAAGSVPSSPFFPSLLVMKNQPDTVHAAEIFEHCIVVQGCSDILSAGILKLTGPSEQRPSTADIQSSLKNAQKHLESEHGPSDYVYLDSPIEDNRNRSAGVPRPGRFAPVAPFARCHDQHCSRGRYRERFQVLSACLNSRACP